MRHSPYRRSGEPLQAHYGFSCRGRTTYVRHAVLTISRFRLVRRRGNLHAGRARSLTRWRRLHCAWFERLRGIAAVADLECCVLQCAYLRSDAPWYRSSIPQWCCASAPWAIPFFGSARSQRSFIPSLLADFVTVPAFLACMAVQNGQPLFRRDSLAMVVIGSAGFAANFFSAQAFVGSSALVSFIGSFVVGVLGNTWAQVTRESAFVSAKRNGTCRAEADVLALRSS